jgi:DNA-binding transcriptional MocR family regulator
MMTISRETTFSRQGHRYQAIADELADKIAGGDLQPGVRLPTHRDLAGELGVTVGTVTRAYAELERRGLVRGEVGRGTFVRHDEIESLITAADERGDGAIDLSSNYPAPGVHGAELIRVLREVADNAGSGGVLSYQVHAGRPEHRAAGAKWVGRCGYEVSPGRVIVTTGAQHALLVALSTALSPGGRLGVEAVAFPGTKSLAAMFNYELEPLTMDEEGILPEAVDAYCREGVRVICCVPSLQNPTNAVMSPARRRAIAEIVQAHDALIVEDDIFGLLLEEPLPPISSFAPDNGIYLTSLSKTVAPGLRIGYLVVPPALFDQARMAVRATCWMAPPVMAEIATRWISDGTAALSLARQKEEAASRMAMALDILGPWGAQGPAGALQIWFELPGRWTTTEFVAAAGNHGVTLTTEAPFVVPGAESPRAVRICLGTPGTRPLLETALRRLAEVLREGPEAAVDLTIM